MPFHFLKPELKCGFRIRGTDDPCGIIISPTTDSCQIFKFPAPGFLGWTNWVDRSLPVGQDTVQALSDSPSRLYIGGFELTGGSASNLHFLSRLKTTGAYTTHVTSFTTRGIQSLLAMSDDDTVYIGSATDTGAADAYRFTHSGGFTTLGWPGAASDFIFVSGAFPADADLLFWSNQIGTAGGGLAARLYTYRISTATWTQIGGDGTGWTAAGTSNSVPQVVTDGTFIYVMVLGGAANRLDVLRAPLSNLTSWTTIGGASLNGSWATGTKRNGRLLYHQGKLYAGIGGSTAGDAEMWVCTSPATAPAWTQPGGDGINGSWAGAIYTNASRLVGHGDFVVIGLAGPAAGDSDVWMYKISTNFWEQIGGDGIRSSWTSFVVPRTLLVDREEKLWAAPDNANAALSAALWSNDPLLS